MPIFLNSHSRRHFLKTLMIGSAVVSFPRSLFAADNDFHVAFISDTHIPADPKEVNRGFNPCENLKRITPEIIESKPELVIHVGDVARLEGKVEEYQQAASLLQPIAEASPMCLAMGNHDDRVNFATVFKSVHGEKQKIAGKNVVVLEHNVARFIILDSLLYVNKSAGQLGKAQRTWLAKYIASAKDRPIVIVVHHSLGDNDGELADVELLFQLIQPFPHVKAIFYGHSHSWSLTERQNVKLINLPAVGYNFADKEPVGWVDARFNPGGVELTMHVFGGNTSDNGKKFTVSWST